LRSKPVLQHDVRTRSAAFVLSVRDSVIAPKEIRSPRILTKQGPPQKVARKTTSVPAGPKAKERRWLNDKQSEELRTSQ
jgi:hypothetical protein